MPPWLAARHSMLSLIIVAFGLVVTVVCAGLAYYAFSVTPGVESIPLSAGKLEPKASYLLNPILIAILFTVSSALGAPSRPNRDVVLGSKTEAGTKPVIVNSKMVIGAVAILIVLMIEVFRVSRVLAFASP